VTYKPTPNEKIWVAMRRRKNTLGVSIDNDKGKIRLRWRSNSERYSLNLSWPYKRSCLIDAKKIAECIEDDIEHDLFDASLLKYKNLKLNVLSTTESLIQLSPKVSERASSGKQFSSNDSINSFTTLAGQSQKKDGVGINFVKLFDTWTTSYRNVNGEENAEYYFTKKMLVRWQLNSGEEVIVRLQNEKFW